MQSIDEQINEVLRLAGVKPLYEQQLDEDVSDKLKNAVIALTLVLCGCKMANIPFMKEDIPSIIGNGVEISTDKIDRGMTGMGEKSPKNGKTQIFFGKTDDEEKDFAVSVQTYEIETELPNSGCILDVKAQAHGITLASNGAGNQREIEGSNDSAYYVIDVKNGSEEYCKNVPEDIFNKFKEYSIKLLKNYIGTKNTKEEIMRTHALNKDEYKKSSLDNAYEIKNEIK